MITKSTTTITSTTARRPRLVVSRRELFLALPPAVLAFAWLVLLFADFGSIVSVLYANADTVSAPVIGELFPHAPPGAMTTLGYLPWYTALWFELATRWVPFHRQLWEVAPWLASLVGIALVSWSTAKVAGRWAASIVAVVLVCAAPRVLTVQFSFDLHGGTVVCACLLDAFLVLLVSRAGRIGPLAVHAALAVGLAAVIASSLASDQLLYVAGLAPFLAAALAQLVVSPGRSSTRVAVTAAAVGALSVIGSRLVIAAMRDRNIYPADDKVTFASWGEMWTHVGQLLRGLAQLVQADFAGGPIGPRPLLALACAAVLAIGLVLVARVGWSEGRRLIEAEPADEPVRRAHVTFWVAGAAFTAVAFVLSSYGSRALQASAGRYFVPIVYAMVVVGAVAAARSAFSTRVIVTLAFCIVLAGSTVALAAHDLTNNPGYYPRQDFASFLETFAQGEGLTYGYADYWDAAPLTWQTHEHVQVYPVVPCPAPHGLCTNRLHVISSWYTPRPGTRSFLITDPRYGPAAPGLRLGGTAEVVSYGEYRIYVYDYDIAANLGDWRRYGVDTS